MVLLFAQERAGTSMVRKVRNTFLIWKKEIMSKNMRKLKISGLITTDLFDIFSE